MIPWADKVAGTASPGYKAATQGWWALGATLGSFSGAQLSRWMGRRTSYLLISFFTTSSDAHDVSMDCAAATELSSRSFRTGLCRDSVLRMACRLPASNVSYSRTSHRQRFAYNSGRFATAAGVLLAGLLFATLGGDYSRVGSLCSVIYAVGMLVVWLLPKESSEEKLAHV